MGTYHQIGHSTHNLATSQLLADKFTGAIMSPVNDDPVSVRRICSSLVALESIFDPQMYLPLSERGKLPKWEYFKSAKDYKPEHLFSSNLWTNILNALVSECVANEQKAVCSPVVANDASNDQIGDAVQVGDALSRVLKGTGISGIQSAFVRASTLVGVGRPETVASILTNGELERIYFIAKWSAKTSETDDANELTAFGRTLQYTASARRTLVGFSGPEMILWKAAGAESVATGKYGNQQRWDLARWESKKSGGAGSASYYFEESLLAWLRTEDIVRLDALGYRLGLAGDPIFPSIRQCVEALQRNPRRSVPIMKNGRVVTKNGKQQTRREGAPEWTAQGWLQWLWWFADTERRLELRETTARELVENARANWRWLAARRFQATDILNDGSWLEAWIKMLDGIGR